MKKKKSRHSDINMRHCDINCDIATLTCVIDHKEEWLNCKRSYWNVIKVQATTNKKKQQICHYYHGNRFHGRTINFIAYPKKHVKTYQCLLTLPQCFMKA